MRNGLKNKVCSLMFCVCYNCSKALYFFVTLQLNNVESYCEIVA